VFEVGPTARVRDRISDLTGAQATTEIKARQCRGHVTRREIAAAPPPESTLWRCGSAFPLPR
jgi:hypothetical protein